MFTSNYQLVHEPNETGVSIFCFKPGTHEVGDIIITPIPVSCELVKLFNAAPEDDRAARDWGIRADARDATMRLFKWLRAAAIATKDMPRFASVIHELAERELKACAASNRLRRSYPGYRPPENQAGGDRIHTHPAAAERLRHYRQQHPVSP
jgi:hypothetical protein